MVFNLLLNDVWCTKIYMYMIFCLCLGLMNVPLSNPYYVGVAPKVTSVSQAWITSRDEHLDKFYKGNNICHALQHLLGLHRIPKAWSLKLVYALRFLVVIA